MLCCVVLCCVCVCVCESILSGDSDFRSIATILTKWHTRVSVLMHAHVLHTEDGDTDGVVYTFAPALTGTDY